MTKIIVVVGKSGSGKTTICNLLAKQLNCNTINIDEIGHSIYDNQEFINFINDRLGAEYINSQGKIIDRKMVGDYIFSRLGTEIVDDFNKLTWRLMEEEIERKLSQQGEYVILDWFNLPNTKYFDIAYCRILVTANDEERRTLMVRLRDNISSEYLEKREQAGIEYDEKDFDFVITNNYDDEFVTEKVNEVADRNSGT